jgi:ZIP family zinc transporter
MAIALAALTFFSTGLGGLVAFRLRDRLHIMMGLASGAVLGVVFFDMLPETFASTNVPRWVLVGSAVGFLAYFLLERFTSLHAAREHEHHAAAPHAPELGMVGASGLAVHSFLDGVAIGIGFQANFAAGMLIALAVLTHDFSDGLNTMTVMLAHGNTTRRSVAFLLLDMTTPLLGAASTLLIQLPATVLPWLLAFFAGSFLYIGASDLLPEAREHKSSLVTVMPIVGMALIFLVTRALPR